MSRTAGEARPRKGVVVSLAVAPPPYSKVHAPEPLVFTNPDILGLIFGQLPLAVVILTTARVSRTWQACAKERTQWAWDELRPLLQRSMPFTPHDFLWLDGQLSAGCRSLGVDGMRVLANACKGSELQQVTWLELDDNQLGDEGFSELVSACADGALPNLRALSLCQNEIGSIGISAFADACLRGVCALTKLGVLDLDDNEIDDDAMIALARAVAGDTLCSLTRLDLERNVIGDAGIAALAGALSASSGLPRLEALNLGKNAIRDAGLAALAQAAAAGALASLERLFLESNCSESRVPDEQSAGFRMPPPSHVARPAWRSRALTLRLTTAPIRRS
jgi:hypothetical protein